MVSLNARLMRSSLGREQARLEPMRQQQVEEIVAPSDLDADHSFWKSRLK
jgi:hypothetical protein